MVREKKKHAGNKNTLLLLSAQYSHVYLSTHTVDTTFSKLCVWTPHICPIFLLSSFNSQRYLHMLITFSQHALLFLVLLGRHTHFLTVQSACLWATMKLCIKRKVFLLVFWISPQKKSVLPPHRGTLRGVFLSLRNATTSISSYTAASFFALCL